MNPRRAIPPATIAAQRHASDPQASVWVSAHAGSGKTHVLTQRVVRLLLEGAPPSKILCLTYTKAAAANMSLRVFDMLSKWAMLDDTALARAIAAAGAEPRPQNLVFARRLFARAVETPGGLKIQTIHAFCERLLHLFPFEANVPSRFQLLEDADKNRLLANARRAALAGALAAPESAAGKALAVLSAAVSESGFDDLLAEALASRRGIYDAIRAAGTLEKYPRHLAKHFGLTSEETLDAIERGIIEDGIPPGEWPALEAALRRGGVNDGKLADACHAASALAGAARADAWLGVFMTQQGAPRGAGKQKIISAALQKLEPGLLEKMEGERGRLAALRDKRMRALIAGQTAALLEIADAVLQKYQAAKNARGLLDFDDLIEKTLALLTRSDAGWVLFKLDSGIDHILIDEAQDTSPVQWEILRGIAEEFTAGAGQRAAKRTFFAVGDEKQSIYSFQGARPDMFDAMRRLFMQRTLDSGGQFREVKLNLSFRSAPPVLDFVDAVFALPENRKGLTSDGVRETHEAWKKEIPGRIEIWDPIEPMESPPPDSWLLPLDAPGLHDPPVVLAGLVARLVAGWLKPGSPDGLSGEYGGAPRPIRAGDVIVLVRTRSAFFDAVVRAFKDAGVPVAGADRLKFAEHIAVMDLIAAGRASQLPLDDLALACLLKSPLIGLDDDDLIELAPLRKASLDAVLTDSAKASHQAAAARIAIWRERACALTPFLFYSLLLGADGGRRALLARLGPEAGDAIDEFLNQALRHEQAGPPSLAAFLAGLESSGGEVKRDMEAAGDFVRVMTIHAAKGLEAKIVILPDTCSTPEGKHDPKIFTLENPELGPALAWSPRKDCDAGPVIAARALAREAAADEYRRLLYVAATRAEERLYIMGYQGARGRNPGCWHDMIRAALDGELVASPAFWSPEGRVWRRAADAAASVPPDAFASREEAAPPPPPLPAWLVCPAKPEEDAPPPVRPSSAFTSAGLTGPAAGGSDPHAGALAARLGRLTHTLLQHLPDLPAENRRQAALRFLGMRAPGIPDQERAALADRALAVLALPGLTALFAPGSLSEAPLAGRVDAGGGRFVEISGQIDRLAVTETEVLFADFKTGKPRERGETPAAYAFQLALYRAALAAIYPLKTVRALLVWVNGPSVVEFSAAEMESALLAARSAQIPGRSPRQP